MSEDKIEYEEETPEVEVNEEEPSKGKVTPEETVGVLSEESSDTSDSKKEVKEVKLPDKLDKISDEKIRGRIIVFNPEKSEFAKNLSIKEAGDYVEKK
jgi:hypothetical protein